MKTKDFPAVIVARKIVEKQAERYIEMTRKFEMLKVFDCQDMPDDVRQVFFEMCEQGNNCYVAWWPCEATYLDDNDVRTDNPDHSKVDQWLLENGANPDEKVIVRHSW